MLDVLLVHGTAFPPANEHVVPGDLTLLELPPLLLGVELGRERGVYDVRVLFVVVVGRYVEPKRLAQGHRVAHPGLPELVVGRALVTVLDLLVVPLLCVRQAKPLERQREHPVDRPLELLLLLRVPGERFHPLLSVPEVEVLLAVHLDESPLPRTIRTVLVDVTEQNEPGPVVEPVSDDELREALERYVEGIGVLELPRLALVDELLRVHPQIPEHAVGDVRVPELVLHYPHDGDVVVDARERREVFRRVHVCRRAYKLGVGRHDKSPLQPLDVPLRRLRRFLDEPPALDAIQEYLFSYRRHAFLLCLTWLQHNNCPNCPVSQYQSLISLPAPILS